MIKNYRCCISCRKVDHRQFFWRVVRQFPSHAVQLDTGMGRSAYLCPSKQCLKLAQKKNRLGRALKTSIPAEIYAQLAQRLAEKSVVQSTPVQEDEIGIETKEGHNNATA